MQPSIDIFFSWPHITAYLKHIPLISSFWACGRSVVVKGRVDHGYTEVSEDVTISEVVIMIVVEITDAVVENGHSVVGSIIDVTSVVRTVPTIKKNKNVYLVIKN